MAEIQSIDDIRDAYWGEWVIIVDYEDDESGWLARGRVVAHGPSKDDVYRELANHPGGGAVRYFGEALADQIVIL